MTTVITTTATETPAATPGITAIARRLDTSDTQQLAHRLTPVFAAWLDALGAADPTRMSDEDIRLMAAAANRIGVRDALIVTALNAEEAGTAEHAAAVATEPHTPEHAIWAARTLQNAFDSKTPTISPERYATAGILLAKATDLALDDTDTIDVTGDPATQQAAAEREANLLATIGYLAWFTGHDEDATRFAIASHKSQPDISLARLILDGVTNNIHPDSIPETR